MKASASAVCRQTIPRYLCSKNIRLRHPLTHSSGCRVVLREPHQPRHDVQHMFEFDAYYLDDRFNGVGRTTLLYCQESGCKLQCLVSVQYEDAKRLFQIDTMLAPIFRSVKSSFLQIRLAVSKDLTVNAKHTIHRFFLDWLDLEVEG